MTWRLEPDQFKIEIAERNAFGELGNEGGVALTKSLFLILQITCTSNYKMMWSFSNSIIIQLAIA